MLYRFDFHSVKFRKTKFLFNTNSYLIMKTKRRINFLFFLILTTLVFYSGNAQPPGENPSNWAVVNSLTDEFNGSNLNTGKWNYGHPWWIGRSPSLFGGAANAFVNNGLLVMKPTWVGGATNFMRSGSIHSKNRDMRVGMYSEVQFRSHGLKMGNGFWFAHNARDSQNREDEIDVQEAFPTRFPRVMNTNIHNPQPNFTNDQPQPNTFTIPNNGTVQGEYHRYGVWIVNNRTLRFYLDGVFQKQVRTNSTIEPLWLIFNQETYDWIRPVPNQAELNNDAINRTYVGYIRTWRKTGNSNPPPPGGGGSKVLLKGNNGKYVSSENGAKAMTCNRSSAQGWEKFSLNVIGNSGGNDIVTIQGNNGRYVSSENGQKNVTCNRTNVGGWEKFVLIHHGNNVYSFKGNNGKYLSSENGNGGMTCSRANIGNWEKFTITFGVKSNEANIKDIVSTEHEVTTYPNPIATNGSLSMSFKLVEQAKISIELYNIVGQKVLSNNLGTYKTGNHDIKLFTRSSELSSGIYLLKIKMNDIETVDRLRFN